MKVSVGSSSKVAWVLHFSQVQMVVVTMNAFSFLIEARWMIFVLIESVYWLSHKWEREREREKKKWVSQGGNIWWELQIVTHFSWLWLFISFLIFTLTLLSFTRHESSLMKWNFFETITCHSHLSSTCLNFETRRQVEKLAWHSSLLRSIEPLCECIDSTKSNCENERFTMMKWKKT